MDEYQQQTEFLKTCLRYDDSAGSRVLEQEMTRLQRDERCVRRATWLMANLAALAAAALLYPFIMMDNFPSGLPDVVLIVIYATGGSALLSLIIFMGVGVGYRMKLDKRRKECRLKVNRVLRTRLGTPSARPLQESAVAAGNPTFSQTTTGINNCSADMTSAGTD